MEHHEGKLKFWHEAKGFGFITPDNGGADIFLHASALRRAGLPEPAEGDRYRFAISKDDRGRLSADEVESL